MVFNNESCVYLDELEIGSWLNGEIDVESTVDSGRTDVVSVERTGRSYQSSYIVDVEMT